MLKWIQEASENQLRLIKTGIDYELSPQAVKDRRDEGELMALARVVTGVLCTRCGVVLPPHTVGIHLDTDHAIHECPLHGSVIE